MNGDGTGAAATATWNDRLIVGWRQRVISGLLVFFVAMLVVLNAPVSEERTMVLDDFANPIDFLHLNQSWVVFSPDPSRVSVDFWADVELVSGDVERFEFPKPGLWLGVYTNYRFRKYQRRMVEVGNEFHQVRTADLIRREFDEPVQSVTLMRRFVVTAEPGSGTEPSSTTDTVLEVVYGPGAPDAVMRETP